MNLAPIRVEYAHGDGARWPIRVDDKLDRTRNVLGVGAPFTNDLGRTVEELNSVLHCQSRVGRRRPSSSRYTRSAVVAPSAPLIERRLACPSRAPQQARADALQTKRPAGARAAMNKHHPYALGDDPPSPLRKDALQFVQRAKRRGMHLHPQLAGFLTGRKVGVLRHPTRGIQPDLSSRPLRHDKRDAPPVCGRPAGVGCPVGQDHVTLALASLPIGFGAVVAN